MIVTWTEFIKNFEKSKMTMSAMQILNEKAPIVNQAPLYQLGELEMSIKAKFEDTYPAPQTRNFNEDYGTNKEKKSEKERIFNAVIIGDTLKVDRLAGKPDSPGVVNIIHDRLIGSAYYMERVFLYGDSKQGNTLDGIKRIARDYSNVFAVDTNGSKIDDSEANALKFYNALSNAVFSISGGATHIYMTSAMFILVSKAANLLGQKWFSDSNANDVNQNLGRIITTLFGIPVFLLEGKSKVSAIGDTSYKNIIDFDQTCGTSTEACSDIFIVRWGSNSSTDGYIAFKPDGIDFTHQGEMGSFHNFQLDITTCVGTNNKKAFSVVEGILPPA